MNIFFCSARREGSGAVGGGGLRVRTHAFVILCYVAYSYHLRVIH